MDEPQILSEQEREDALRQAAKRELRRRMRALRKSLPASGVERRSAQIVARLAALAPVAAARKIALFWPIEGRNEVDLRALLRGLLADGRQVALPVTDGDEIALRYIDDPDSIAPGPLGFDEPPADGVRADDVDVVIAPALAVDARGHRLGYGRGYYDRLLARLAPPAAVVVAYDFQLIGEVPTTGGDVALGWVVTDRRAFRVGDDPGEAPLEPFGGDEPPAPPAPAPEERPGVKVIARPRRPG